MRERTTELERLGISRELALELKYFCLQYPEKAARLRGIREGRGRPPATGMPGAHRPGDPTGTAAERAMLDACYRDCEAIEQAAIEADDRVYQWIIRAVGYGVPYDRLGVPMGINQFGRAKIRFFLALAKKLGKASEKRDA